MLNIKADNDILTISHIGYETFSEKITLQTRILQIRLKQFAVQFGEIIVNNFSAQDLLKSAIKKILDNYEQAPFLAKTYYREKALEKDTIIYYAGSIIRYYTIVQKKI